MENAYDRNFISVAHTIGMLSAFDMRNLEMRKRSEREGKEEKKLWSQNTSPLL